MHIFAQCAVELMMHCANISSAVCCINGALRIVNHAQCSLSSWVTVIKPRDALGESGLYIFIARAGYCISGIGSCTCLVVTLGAINIIPDSLCGY